MQVKIAQASYTQGPPTFPAAFIGYTQSNILMYISFAIHSQILWGGMPSGIGYWYN